MFSAIFLTCLLVKYTVQTVQDTPYDVTDEQLRAITEQLWTADTNRAPDGYVRIDTDGDNLFTYVNPALWNGPTYSRFRDLLDNYEPEIGIPEGDCPTCRAEETAFIDTIMQTEVMQRAWRFLADNDLASTTESGFKDELRQYWFMPYSRSRGFAIDSSGFEHVFLGEVRGESVTGFHNWIQYYEQERQGEATYINYQNECPPVTLSLGMSWLGRLKPITSLIISVSPEFEIALFTLCFQARQTSRCYASLDGNEAEIVTFEMSNVVPRTVGTTYNRC